MLDTAERMITLSETVNWFELASLVVTLAGLALSVVNVRSAFCVRTLLRSVGMNGLKKLISQANIDGELTRLGAQIVTLVLVVNALTLPSRYGWQSVLVSLGLVLVSLFLARGSLISRRLRRQINHEEE